MRYLLDSNVIIYHLNGKDSATEFIESHSDESSISFITAIEVMAFEYSDHEKALVTALLEGFQRLDIDDAIIKATIGLRVSSKVKLPDCVIAATAISRGLTLVTRNTDDLVVRRYWA